MLAWYCLQTPNVAVMQERLELTRISGQYKIYYFTSNARGLHILNSSLLLEEGGRQV